MSSTVYILLQFLINQFSSLELLRADWLPTGNCLKTTGAGFQQPG